MKTRANSGRLINTSLKRVKNPLRYTALVYLKQALLEERYEDCAEIISFALEFGAKDYEIEALLEDPRRTPQP